MNIFNRFIMACLSLVFLTIGITALLLLTKLVTPTAVSPGGLFTTQWHFFTQLSSADTIKVALAAGLLSLISAIVFLLEITPRRRVPRS